MDFMNATVVYGFECKYRLEIPECVINEGHLVAGTLIQIAINNHGMNPIPVYYGPQLNTTSISDLHKDIRDYTHKNMIEIAMMDKFAEKYDLVCEWSIVITGYIGDIYSCYDRLPLLEPINA
jgi:hypothetical protein